MSTRCNIVVKETYNYKDTKGKPVSQTSKLFFYRHSDGYPEGAMPILNVFMKWLKSGKIRTDLQQASGWLILLGAMEYNTLPEFNTEKPHFEGGHAYGDIGTIQDPKDWKCGSIEPTTCIHGDIDYLYVIDLNKKEIACFERWTDEGEGKGEPLNLQKQLQ